MDVRAASPPVPDRPVAGARARLGYLDWLRGAAVVIMIEAHTLDSWTQVADRRSLGYRLAMIAGGMGAPLFLFLAGVAVALAAGGRATRIGEAPAAASVRRRGWEIFGLAFLFRLYSWALSPGARLRGLLKVDILNVMGLSIVAAAGLWQLGRTTVQRAAWLATATVAITMLTPLVRTTPIFDPLPDALETYLRPGKGLATFTLFPWSGFVTAGAVCGLAIHAGRLRAGAVAMGCTAVGAVLAVLGYWLSWRPSIYTHSFFWTTSPTFFCVRTGVLTLAVALAYWWERRPWRFFAGRPLETLGASSLFVYWIHVEMVYGILSTPIKRALPLPWVFVAFAAFTALMLGATHLKESVVKRWKAQAAAAAPVRST